jgi:hypothetical protein
VRYGKRLLICPHDSLETHSKVTAEIVTLACGRARVWGTGDSCSQVPSRHTLVLRAACSGSTTRQGTPPFERTTKKTGGGLWDGSCSAVDGGPQSCGSAVDRSRGSKVFPVSRSVASEAASRLPRRVDPGRTGSLAEDSGKRFPAYPSYRPCNSHRHRVHGASGFTPAPLRSRVKLPERTASRIQLWEVSSPSRADVKAVYGGNCACHDDSFAHAQTFPTTGQSGTSAQSLEDCVSFTAYGLSRIRSAIHAC